MQKPSTKTVKNVADKALNKIVVFVCEVIMAALSIQGLLSLIHAQHTIQVSLSVGFVLALLIVRFRTK